MTGIEPAYSAWEADVLPLNYIGAVPQKASTQMALRSSGTPPGPSASGLYPHHHSSPELQSRGQLRTSWSRKQAAIGISLKKPQLYYFVIAP